MGAFLVSFIIANILKLPNIDIRKFITVKIEKTIKNKNSHQSQISKQLVLAERVRKNKLFYKIQLIQLINYFYHRE